MKQLQIEEDDPLIVEDVSYDDEWVVNPNNREDQSSLGWGDKLHNTRMRKKFKPHQKKLLKLI